MSENKKIFFNELRLMSQTVLKSQTPYRTGNLRSTITQKQTKDREFTMSIGGERAPYVIFVNERWRSDQWSGRENPREGFIDRTAELIAQMIMSNPGVRRVI